MSQDRVFDDVFSPLVSRFESESKIRDSLREAIKRTEQCEREVLALLQRVHHHSPAPSGSSSAVLSPLSDQRLLADILREAEAGMARVKELLASLSQLVPVGEYYRFSDQLRFVNQRASFLAAFLCYLRDNRLLTHEQLCSFLGLGTSCNTGYSIDIEDYLQGQLQLANELNRLAVNSVIAGDLSRPARIHEFLLQLDSGFRLLMLKNDALRRRYDALKYDVKRVEEIVYDLAVRALPTRESTQPSVHGLASASDPVPPTD